MMIVVVFVISFGVITQAMLYTNNTFDWNLVKKIINKAYWPIFGEMKILEEISEIDEASCESEGTCPVDNGIFFSYIALMIYMIIGNILLVNLLIAMFR